MTTWTSSAGHTVQISLGSIVKVHIFLPCMKGIRSKSLRKLLFMSEANQNVMRIGRIGTLPSGDLGERLEGQGVRAPQEELRTQRQLRFRNYRSLECTHDTWNKHQRRKSFATWTFFFSMFLFCQDLMWMNLIFFHVSCVLDLNISVLCFFQVLRTVQPSTFRSTLTWASSTTPAPASTAWTSMCIWAAPAAAWRIASWRWERWAPRTSWGRTDNTWIFQICVCFLPFGRFFFGKMG